MYYKYEDITDEKLIAALDDCELVKKKNKYYINAPCAFDIETSSFYENGEKRSVMYLWQVDLNGLCFYGREWPEFIELLNRLHVIFYLSKKVNLIIYVHNLSYEFQFLRKWLEWDNVFARKTRKPIIALCTLGILFKCSYMLSNYSLKKVAENLHSHKIEKLDYEYDTLRLPCTPLDEAEIQYGINDVVIIEFFIREEIERNGGSIANIPLTNTGYVRRQLREACYNPAKKRETRNFSNFIHALTLEQDEYMQCKRAFMGGFTHANAWYVGDVVENVKSYDFTSSYPYVMLSEKYPMTKGRLVEDLNGKPLDYYFNRYCCIFDVHLVELESITNIDHPISYSKCRQVAGAIIDNGRVESADRLETTMTNVDWEYLQWFYRWNKEQSYIYNLRIYDKDYLPKPIAECIVDLYTKKTSLKGVAGAEVEYMHSKGMLNACYGCTVTDIAPPEVSYADDWQEHSVDLDCALNTYNKAKQRFLFYPWGVFVTAYARRNLFTGILAAGDDYIYADTDSIKIRHAEKIEDYFDLYNKKCEQKLQLAFNHWGLDYSLYKPRTIKGVEKPLGVWDFDGDYAKFKTLGAKRYLVETPTSKVKMTVAGVNGNEAVHYLENAKTDVFNAFDFDLEIPAGDTGKMTLTYIDDEIEGIANDYLGSEYRYYEKSCIHMEPASYNFSASDEFIAYLMGLTLENPIDTN